MWFGIEATVGAREHVNLV